MEWQGLTGTTAYGVFFTEQPAPAEARLLGRAQVGTPRQNSNLDEIKRRLAAEARRRGGTALVNFRYGQRATRPFELRWGSERWFGEGDVIA